MALVGSWTDSTGSGVTYPTAYLVAHERIDTARQIVFLDVKIWPSSTHVGRRPLYSKTLVPTGAQIDTIVNLVEGRADTALQARAQFSGMSTTS